MINSNNSGYCLLFSYVVGGPYVSHSTDRRSYGMESVEDDPFIAASTQSLNSVDGRDKKKDSSVNYGYLPDCKNCLTFDPSLFSR